MKSESDVRATYGKHSRVTTLYDRARLLLRSLMSTISCFPKVARRVASKISQGLHYMRTDSVYLRIGVGMDELLGGRR